jgi:hypothetical protein
MMAIDLWEEHTCASCKASAHDVIADESRYAVLECLFCGLVIRVEPLGRVKPAGVKPAAPAVAFRFPSGRFIGKTVEEVAAEENGPKYLQFARENYPEWRGFIEAHLFQGT